MLGCMNAHVSKYMRLCAMCVYTLCVRLCVLTKNACSQFNIRPFSCPGRHLSHSYIYRKYGQAQN